MIAELEELQRKAEAEIAEVRTEKDFLDVKTRYLGRKGC